MSSLRSGEECGLRIVCGFRESSLWRMSNNSRCASQREEMVFLVGRAVDLSGCTRLNRG